MQVKAANMSNWVQVQQRAEEGVEVTERCSKLHDRADVMQLKAKALCMQTPPTVTTQGGCTLPAWRSQPAT